MKSINILSVKICFTLHNVLFQFSKAIGKGDISAKHALGGHKGTGRQKCLLCALSFAHIHHTQSSNAWTAYTIILSTASTAEGDTRAALCDSIIAFAVALNLFCIMLSVFFLCYSAHL